MAKMFYTLEEAADKLGVDQQTIKDMAARNELQQFRDGDKLMFKRDQVDAKSSSGESDGPISLADTGMGDSIDLQSDTAVGVNPPAENPNEATGVSVFDAGEIDLADPMAQTQVTGPTIDDEELALESVGSGSGLLDLTRESDDTSLGAELLDEIYPGADSMGTGTNMGTGISMDSAVGSSGVFDGEISMETGTSGPSGLENLTGEAPATTSATAGATRSTAVYEEPNDPAGSWFGAGMLFGVLLALIVGLAAMIPAVYGVQGTFVQGIDPIGPESKTYIVAGGLLAVSVIFGVIGLLVGKSAAR